MGQFLFFKSCGEGGQQLSCGKKIMAVFPLYLNEKQEEELRSSLWLSTHS